MTIFEARGRRSLQRAEPASGCRRLWRGKKKGTPGTEHDILRSKAIAAGQVQNKPDYVGSPLQDYARAELPWAAQHLREKNVTGHLRSEVAALRVSHQSRQK